MKSKSYLILLLMLLAFIADAGYSHAAQLSVNEIPELGPMKDLIPEEEFKSKTKSFDNEQKTRKNLAFDIRIPSDWEEVDSYADVSGGEFVLGESVLGVISRFIGPSSPVNARSFISIEALKLRYEIGVKSWFINHALLNGLSLERMSVKNRRELEAVYVEVKKDTTYIVRTRALLNGSKMIVLKYYVTQENFQKEKTMQAQVVGSFKLKYPDDAPIEDLKTFGFLSQSYFDYPPSWVLTAPSISSIDRMNAQLHRSVVEGKLEGKIAINLTNKLSASSRSEIIKEFRDNFSIERYKVGDFIGTTAMEYHKDMSFGIAQAYELRPEASNMIGYELWVTIMENDDYYYLVSLVTPARGEEFYTWARNVETYKLVIRKMRRRNGGKKLFDFIK